MASIAMLNYRRVDGGYNNAINHAWNGKHSNYGDDWAVDGLSSGND